MKLPYRNRSHRRLTCHFAVSWYAALLIASLPAHAIAQGAAASEYAVKAAIIFKIAKFVSWPKHVYAGQSEPLSVCVRKNDPIAAAMSALSGKPIHGRALSVRYFDNNPKISSGCQILFMSDASDTRQLALLDSIAGQPVLTIGNSQQFTRRGGIIGLEIKNNRVQFAINIAASETAGLDISAQLLQLAKITDSSQGT